MYVALAKAASAPLSMNFAAASVSFLFRNPVPHRIRHSFSGNSLPRLIRS